MTWDIESLNLATVTPIVTQITNKSVVRAKELCPVGQGSTAGRMRDSISGSVTPAPPTGHVTIDDPAAKYVLNGTAPHVEEATGGAMVFPSGGATVFATTVSHPGNAANPFLTRAIEEVMRGG